MLSWLYTFIFLRTIIGTLVFFAAAFVAEKFLAGTDLRIYSQLVAVIIVSLAAIIGAGRFNLLKSCLYAMRTVPGVLSVVMFVAASITGGSLAAPIGLAVVSLIAQLRIWIIDGKVRMVRQPNERSTQFNA